MVYIELHAFTTSVLGKAVTRDRKQEARQVDPKVLLANAAKSIRTGGRETLSSPPFLSCGSDGHDPFRLGERPLQIREGDGSYTPGKALWGTVRTYSSDHDGERTDLHDIWSLCWAAFLRAAGIASPSLLDEEGFLDRSELSARHLVIRPHSWPLRDDEAFARARASLSAWTAFAYHLLDGVFDWQQAGRRRVGVLPYQGAKAVASWVEPVLRTLRHPRDYTTTKRIGPTWVYLSALPRGVSIVRLPKVRLRALEAVLAPYRPNTVTGEQALAIFANGIANGVPFKTIKLAQRLMERTGDPCDTPLILPIDSHCIFLGDKTLIAIRESCGQEVYNNELKRFLKRRAAEDTVFFADSRIAWHSPLDAGDFEDLCVDLVSREPGVSRVKPVGGVNDRDSGRDILIDWTIPRHHSASGMRQTQRVRVLAQVKTRGRTVGKGDVRDIRDTLERHDAKGFLLIAHPRISAPLVDYLEDLRRRKDFSVEWWEIRDLESRLRRHPDIARRYPKLLDLVVESGA